MITEQSVLYTNLSKGQGTHKSYQKERKTCRIVRWTVKWWIQGIAAPLWDGTRLGLSLINYGLRRDSLGPSLY